MIDTPFPPDHNLDKVVAESVYFCGGTMMRKSIVATAVLLCALTCAQVFGQISNATVSGTIEDATHAVLPGVTITATDTATGVTTTAVSNEAGTYNLPSLLPGPYKVSAELAGFQTRSYEVTLG